MKRSNPLLKDGAVALARSQSKKQRLKKGAEPKVGSLQDKRKDPSVAMVVTKPEKTPYQDVSLKDKNRHRLPNKIMTCLCEGIEPDVIWWSPHKNGFTVDSDTVQKKLLDVHFKGTKLTSLVRSLNRWGFRRDFYRTLPKRAMAFLHPQFKKGRPHLLKDMKISSSMAQEVEADSTDDEETVAQKKDGDEGKPPATRSLIVEPANEPTPPRRLAASQQSAVPPFSAGLFHPSLQHRNDGSEVLAGILQPRGPAAAGAFLPTPSQQAMAQLLSRQLGLLQPLGLQPGNVLPSENQFLRGNPFREATLLQQLVQQQQQQQQQDQMSAYLQTLLGLEASHQASLLSRSLPLQDFALARQQEENLRILRSTPFQLHSEQGQLAALLNQQHQQQQHRNVGMMNDPGFQVARERELLQAILQHEQLGNATHHREAQRGDQSREGPSRR